MIDITRTQGVFDARKFDDPIHIIGVGATGSYICRSLILQGISGRQIHVYDFDVVEEHNISNQAYGLSDIGKPKVDAIADMVKSQYGEVIHTHEERVDNKTRMQGVVFILVDTFAARKQIMKGLKMKPGINLIMETRLDARAGYINSMHPMNLEHMKWFEQSLFDDDEDDPNQEVSACGTRQTVGASVQTLANLAVWDFMNIVTGKAEVGRSEFFSFSPFYYDSNKIEVDEFF